MIKKITKKKWKEAQEAEAPFHQYSMEEGLRLYGFSYSNHFRYLDIPEDLGYRTIIEVGCAGFPALNWRKNYKGIVIEPLNTETLKTICKGKNILWIKEPVEELDMPKCDELWLFNVMQHIQDPELFIEKCKESANVIKWFEPIDYPVCVYHPHTFSREDFIRWFGHTQIYKDFVPHFHDAICSFGTWKK